MKNLSPTWFRRWLRDHTGTITVELVLILPLLLWAFISFYVFWDAYQSRNRVQKAAYTASDMLSRELTTLTPTYLNGMATVIDYLTHSAQPAQIRVTSATRLTDAEDGLAVQWSYSPGNALPAMTTADLYDIRNEIPLMALGTTAIILEVSVPFQPALNVGLSASNMTEFLVTRPRFLPKLCLSTAVCS
jgi:Flp pilus assembly protein TadG